MPGDPRSPNPIKLKKPFHLNDECYWHVRAEIFRYVEMFMDHLDFELLPWQVEDSDTGKKMPMYIQDMNMLRKMHKLKYDSEQAKISSPRQPNSNNWNFGSVPPELLKKKT